MNPLPLLWPELAAKIAVWLIEFTACLSGPLVQMDRGTYCTRYNLDTSQWSPTGQDVTLKDFAVAQNMWFCAYPFGCQVRR